MKTGKKLNKEKKVFMITFKKWLDLVLKIFLIFLLLLGIALTVVAFTEIAIREYCPCL